MTVRRTVRVAVLDGGHLGDIVRSRSEGGLAGDRGLRELVGQAHPGVELFVDILPATSCGDLRIALTSGTSPLISSSPDLVLLSVAGEVERLLSGGDNVEEAVHVVEEDLLGCVNLLKEKVGAHILVANVSTLEPGSAVFSYHELTEEPYSLRAHRLNLMLVNISHEEGISIVDVDRKIAEVGGENAITELGAYNELGASVLAAEVFRIIDEYGFFDDRPVLEQVGARAARQR